MTPLNQASDNELIGAILRHDNLAMGELYSRYYHKVFQKCLTMMKDHDQAFDLAEESLIKAFDKLSTFRGGSSFSTWLYTITHRQCLEAMRKERRKNIEKGAVIDETGDRHAGVSDADATEEREEIMLALINALPPDDKKLLLSKYTDGETIESLQRSMEISSSAIKMRLMRTKEKLNHLYSLASVFGLEAVLSQLEQL